MGLLPVPKESQLCLSLNLQGWSSHVCKAELGGMWASRALDNGKSLLSWFPNTYQIWGMWLKQFKAVLKEKSIALNVHRCKNLKIIPQLPYQESGKGTANWTLRKWKEGNYKESRNLGNGKHTTEKINVKNWFFEQIKKLLVNSVFSIRENKIPISGLKGECYYQSYRH